MSDTVVVVGSGPSGRSAASETCRFLEPAVVAVEANGYVFRAAWESPSGVEAGITGMEAPGLDADATASHDGVGIPDRRDPGLPVAPPIDRGRRPIRPARTVSEERCT
ncbi:MAG: hypothetical protein ABEJ42_08375 [Halobacteriaceae archaeon]